MISSITLERFRGFDHAPLPLKPLTVLLGPNSAGKSSFLQALAALHFIRRAKVSPATLAPEGLFPYAWPFDFGTRDSLICAGSRDRTVRITVAVDHAQGHDASTSVAYDFGYSHSSLELSRVRIDDHPRSPTTGNTVGLPMIAPSPSAVPVAAASIVASTGAPEQPREFVRAGATTWLREPANAGNVTVENLLVKEFVTKSGSATVYAENWEGQNLLLDALDGVRYLQASRVSSRRFELRPEGLPVDDVGPAGEWTGEVWLDPQPADVKVRRPPGQRQLSRRDALDLLRAPIAPEETMPFAVAVDFWAAHLGIANGVQARRHSDVAIEVHVNIDGRNRSLADVGYGVSQVLPILVQGLALAEDGTLLVEQPEAQLHPRPQAHLADFFCSLAQQGRNSIVETHSESFFRRLHLRALLDPSLRDRIAVYFIDPPGPDGCSAPVLVALDRDAAPAWPKGFLSESVEAYASFAAVRAALAAKTSPR